MLSKLLRFRTLWAYGFDSAAQRALEKSKIGEKEKYFIPLPKVIREVLADNLFGLSAVLTAHAGVQVLKIARFVRERGWQISLIMPSMV